MKRVLLSVLLVVVSIPVAVALLIRFDFPRVSAAPDLVVERTPARVERGRYLFHHVARCASCHSARDWSHYSGPVVAGTVGQGGEDVGTASDPAVASNITPAAIGEWTDGEILRAIASGVDREGNPLNPRMPYREYRALAEEDLHAIIAYVRTLSPIENETPENRPRFPASVVFRFLPRDYRPPPPIPAGNQVAWGARLADVAGCRFCHTPFQRGRALEGRDFSGGHVQMYPGGESEAANITSDEDTGIGFYGEDDFVELFQAYGSESARRMPLRGGNNTTMPWTDLAGMTAEDLSAIHAYLQTVPKVRSAISLD